LTIWCIIRERGRDVGMEERRRRAIERNGIGNGVGKGRGEWEWGREGERRNGTG
jgi:hypothetical protein